MSLRTLARYGSSLYHRTLVPPASPAISILMYHRVSGDVDIELDLPYELFKHQLGWLKETKAVIDYPAAVEQLVSGRQLSGLQYVLTFDDAYADFYTNVMPVLRELQLPATLFVPTEFIDHPERTPLSRSVPGSERLTPMTWDQLREVVEDPLVTIGSHTHTHPELPTLSDAQIEDEMQRSAERFKKELGFVPKHFAYPRGKWNAHVAKVIQPFCQTATIVGQGLATVQNTERYAVPRIPVMRSDGWKWFTQRAQGYLYSEERAAGAVNHMKRRLKR